MANNSIFAAFERMWQHIASALSTKAEKSEIPNQLPNPNKLTLTGAVTGEYDGSTAVTFNIPTATGSDGEESVGIESIEQIVGVGDGAEHEIIVHLTNGETQTLYLYNGSKGSNGLRGETGATGAAGIGIQSVEQIVTSDSDNGENKIRVTLSNNNTFDFVVKNGSKGSQGAKGDKGETGSNGTSVTVTSVSESTADGGSNTVTFSDGKTLTVKNGSKGSTGSAGTNGTSVTVTNVSTSTADGGNNVVTFSDGKTLAVKNGSTGKDGVSVTHSWNGTTLSVTSASGTTSANLKGEKGAKGDKGDPYTLTEADKEIIVLSVLSNFTDVSEVAL